MAANGSGASLTATGIGVKTHGVGAFGAPMATVQRGRRRDDADGRDHRHIRSGRARGGRQRRRLSDQSRRRERPDHPGRRRDRNLRNGRRGRHGDRTDHGLDFGNEFGSDGSQRLRRQRGRLGIADQSLRRDDHDLRARRGRPLRQRRRRLRQRRGDHSFRSPLGHDRDGAFCLRRVGAEPGVDDRPQWPEHVYHQRRRLRALRHPGRLDLERQTFWGSPSTATTRAAWKSTTPAVRRR